MVPNTKRSGVRRHSRGSPAHGEAVFRALADPTRRRILGLLRVSGHSVGALAAYFPMSRPAISKHLRLLGSAGLVVSHRRGTARICELNAQPLRSVSDWLRDYQRFWAGSLRRLKKFVEENP
jgi:DNA-binding transcriptional ArsR family regulator